MYFDYDRTISLRTASTAVGYGTKNTALCFRASFLLLLTSLFTKHQYTNIYIIVFRYLFPVFSCIFPRYHRTVHHTAVVMRWQAEPAVGVAARGVVT